MRSLPTSFQIEKTNHLNNDKPFPSVINDNLRTVCTQYETKWLSCSCLHGVVFVISVSAL